jgi:formate hydrogenlyase subunit 3/multisubunit Na+/H+ antiporter MnhD subunit
MSSELSPLNLPSILVAGLLALAVLAYLFRNWNRVVALSAAAITGSCALWLWGLDLADPIYQLPLSTRMVDLAAPFTRWGFTLQLQTASAPIVVASLLLVAAACALAAHIPQGRSFVANSLLLVNGYIALALMTAGPLAPSLLAPIFVVMLSGISIFVLQTERLSQPAEPLRRLVPPVLAFPLFLVAFWYIDQIPLNPQDNYAQQTATHLLALGMILLLAPAPLYGAQPASTQSAPPVSAALSLLLYQLAILHLLFRLVLTFPFLAESEVLRDWLTWAGLATALWGGIAAAGASNPSRLWGYASLHDWGLIMLVLAVPGVRSWLLVLFLFGLRIVSMLTAAAGLAVIEQRSGGLQPQQLRGVATRLPWNSAAFLLGGLGLAGFPLSAGFTGHWAALQLIAQSDWLPAAVVLSASGGAIFSFIRLARDLFGPLQNRYLAREGWISATLAILVLVLSMSLALAPQWLDNPITRTLAALRG